MSFNVENKIVGHLSSLMAVVFFALNVPATSYVLKGWLEPEAYTLLRCTGGLLVAWLVSFFVKGDKITGRRDIMTVILGGFLGLALFFFLYSFGIQKTSPIDAAIILTLSPVLVLVISAPIFKEKITPRKGLGIGIAMAGALLVILMQQKNGNTAGMIGNIVMFCSAAIYSVYLVFTRNVSRKYNPVILLRWMFLSAFVFSLPFCLESLLHSKLAADMSGMPVLVTFFIAVFPTAISYMLIPLALKSLSSTVVSMYNYLIPILATVVAVLLGQAKLRWDEPLAIVLVIVGVYFVTVSSKKSPKKIEI